MSKTLKGGKEMQMPRVAIGVVIALMFNCCHSVGQSAQATNGALYRTFMIQTAIERGTTFSIDVDNREYWITAKHLFTGIKTGPAGVFTPKTVTVAFLAQLGEGEEGHDQHWLTENFTVIDPGKDIDILALVPSHTLLDCPIGFTLNSDAGGVGFGADCEFLGFPYGGGWKAHLDTGKWVWLPYIKHCTVSAQINADVKFWVLDGINNEGFSGGPVLFGTGASQKVFAVIAGFHQEALEVLPAQSPNGGTTGSVPNPPELPGGQTNSSMKQVVNANSGFIIAFDIQPAISAIRSNPTGPLRTPK